MKSKEIKIFTEDSRSKEKINFYKNNKEVFDVGISAEKLRILSSESIPSGHKVEIKYNK